MTLVIALSCYLSGTKKPMVIVAADKQASSTYLKTKVTKTRYLPDKYESKAPLIGFAAAGDAYLADEIFDELDIFISKNIDKLDDVSSFIQANRIELSDIVGNVFCKYQSRGYKSGIDILLIGCNDQSGPVILHIADQGINMIYYDYCQIGQGSVTGGELLLREFYDSKQEDADAVMLLCLVLKLVSEVDISVGKGINVFSCFDNKVQDIPPDQFAEGLEILTDRWRFIKDIWWNFNKKDVQDALKVVHEVIYPPEEEKK